MRGLASHSLRGCVLLVVLGMPAAAQKHVERDAPKPFAAMSASAQEMRDSLVSLARAQVGTRYVTGGQSPDLGFDCSGFVKYVMAALHVSVPRTARQQAATGVAVRKDTTRLRPGDLLTFGKSRKGVVSHVGIYIGNGRYVHASSVAGQVVESRIDRQPSKLAKAWKGARRVFQLGESNGG